MNKKERISMIRLPKNITFEDQPLETRSRRTIRSLLTRILGLYTAMHDRFGQDGLDLVRDISREYGRDIAVRARRDGDPWPIKQIGVFFIRIFNNIYTEGELVDYTDQRVSIRVDRCPYPFDRTEICEAHTEMENALVEGLNPQAEYRVEKSIPGEDEYCLHVIRMKEQTG